MDGDKVVKAELTFIVIFLTAVVLKLARPVFVPFALALLLAYAVSPILDYLVKHRVPRSLALVFVFILTMAVLYFLGSVFYSSGKAFASELPSYNEIVSSFVEGLSSILPGESFKSAIDNFASGIDIGKIGKILVGALGPFISFISDLLLIIIFMIFILAGRGRLRKKLDGALSAEKSQLVTSALHRIDRDIQKYLAVKTLANIIIGILTALVIFVFDLPFAVLFGIIACFLNYIPKIGTIFGIALPALYTGFMFGKPWPMLLVAMILTLLVYAVKSLLERRLMGKASELSPLLILFSLFVWGWLWGLAGMLLAVPILAVVRIIFSNIPSLAPLEKIMSK